MIGLDNAEISPRTGRKDSFQEQLLRKLGQRRDVEMKVSFVYRRVVPSPPHAKNLVGPHALHTRSAKYHVRARKVQVGTPSRGAQKHCRAARRQRRERACDACTFSLRLFSTRFALNASPLHHRARRALRSRTKNHIANQPTISLFFFITLPLLPRLSPPIAPLSRSAPPPRATQSA